MFFGEVVFIDYVEGEGDGGEGVHRETRETKWVIFWDGEGRCFAGGKKQDSQEEEEETTFASPRPSSGSQFTPTNKHRDVSS